MNVLEFVPVIPHTRSSLRQNNETLEWAIQNASVNAIFIVYLNTKKDPNQYPIGIGGPTPSTSLVQNILLHFRMNKGCALPSDHALYDEVNREMNGVKHHQLARLQESFTNAICNQIEYLILIKPRVEKREGIFFIWMQ